MAGGLCSFETSVHHGLGGRLCVFFHIAWHCSLGWLYDWLPTTLLNHWTTIFGHHNSCQIVAMPRAAATPPPKRQTFSRGASCGVWSTGNHGHKMAQDGRLCDSFCHDKMIHSWFVGAKLRWYAGKGTPCWQMIRVDVFLKPTQNHQKVQPLHSQTLRILATDSACTTVYSSACSLPRGQCACMRLGKDATTGWHPQRKSLSNRFLWMSFSQLCRVDMQLYDSRPR